VLQQGLHVHDQEGKLCFEHDKQWQQFEDHQARQVPRIKILGLVQQAGYHQHHMLKEAD
jgi:hypothetical protein